jgi:hypothetical protein
MQVLWWLAPPLGATVLAMIWAAWSGRERDDVRRDDSEEVLARMEKALARPVPAPRRGATPVTAPGLEPSHGVAIRRAARPTAVGDRSR